MRVMLFSTVAFGASGLIMGALNATQHFVAPAAAPVLYNLAIIGGAYFLAPTFGVYGLVIGVVAGSLAHLLVQIPVLLRKGYTYRASLSVTDPGVRKVALLMGPRVLGLFFVQMHFLVNTILASMLATGSLSALNYAWLLMLLPQGIIAQGIATVVFPTFSAQVAAGQITAFRRMLERTLRVVVFLVLPATLTLLVLRRPTISILLERGAFDTESMILVAYGLQFYVAGACLPFDARDHCPQLLRVSGHVDACADRRSRHAGQHWDESPIRGQTSLLAVWLWLIAWPRWEKRSF